MKKITFHFAILVLLINMFPYLGHAQQLNKTRITLHLQHVSLQEAMRQIEALTPFKFIARAEEIEQVHDISLDVRDQSLDKVLDKILTGRKLQYKVIDGNIVIKAMVQDERTREEKPGSQARHQQYSVSGTVRMQRTGETIIGATITAIDTKASVITNDYGFYSLRLPQGNYQLLVTTVGMKPKELTVAVNSDMLLDVRMEEDQGDLENVIIKTNTGERSLGSQQMSQEKMNVQAIRNIPVLFGERDVLKTIQLLPGVKPAGDGSSGFYVRGGSADQNLILLDEAPVYNASHLLGFFSTFNSDAIKSVNLYKGGMPAQYGGRLSSVVDIKMNDGNNQDFGASGGIGLIASRLNIEGPLQKGKSSFLLSGRRTYADLFLKLLGDSGLRKTRLYFYDLNAKSNIILGQKDRVYLSGYFGRDVLSQSTLAGINWGNVTGTLRWNHIFHQNLFSNASLIFSNYEYKININSKTTEYNILSRIRDWNVKEELQWHPHADHIIRLGINSIYHTIKPGEISVKGNQVAPLEGVPDRYALENAVFASDTWKLGSKWNLGYGLRMTAFTILGKGDYYTLDNQGRVIDTLHYKKGEVVKTYLNPEPRVSMSFQWNSTTSVKASYARNTQNLHLISNSSSLSPTDKWVASTNIIKPETADQLAIGYYKDLNNRKLELSVEAYYKIMKNQIDYRNGAQVFTNETIETQLLFGKGRAYGIEWLLKKTNGKITGWISYTLSRTERNINGINEGKWYNARQDRTHDIAIVGMYQLNKKWVLSANWVFYTGDAVTFPSGKYTVDNEVYFYYTERNGYRMPDYHRLDLGATRQLRKRKHFSSELNFSLFNAYGRANAYQINFQESPTNPSKTEAVQTSLFTFVPSISYNFKF